MKSPKGKWMDGIKPSSLLTSGEVCRAIGASPRTVQKYCENGFLPEAYRLPNPGSKDKGRYKGDWRIPLSSLWKFCEEYKIKLPELYKPRSLLLITALSGQVPESSELIEVTVIENPIEACAFIYQTTAKVQVVVGLDFGKTDATKLAQVVQAMHYTPIVVLEDDYPVNKARADFPNLRFCSKPVKWSEILLQMKDELPCSSKMQKG